jgi:membrane-associated phospholipid phosphatase
MLTDLITGIMVGGGVAIFLILRDKIIKRRFLWTAKAIRRERK